MHHSSKPRRVCVFLLQLGGPEHAADIEPFLRNLFEDVLPVPRRVRGTIGRLMARRRAPKVAPLYAQIGGRSPLRANTDAQARAVEQRLVALGLEARVLATMRYAPPRASEVLEEARRSWSDAWWVALPLYPQYSFATTRSSVDELTSLLTTPEQERLLVINAYPADARYIDAVASCVNETLDGIPAEQRAATPVLFSAHGLPLRMVRDGDPYPDHIRQTMAAVQARLAGSPTCHLAFQSRVGPVRWLTPSTTDAVRHLGHEGVRSLVVVPVSFVSEHIETLHELDIQLREIATTAGITAFRRAPTPGTRRELIEALSELVVRALPRETRGSP